MSTHGNLLLLLQKDNHVSEEELADWTILQRILENEKPGPSRRHSSPDLSEPDREKGWETFKNLSKISASSESSLDWKRNSDSDSRSSMVFLDPDYRYSLLTEWVMEKLTGLSNLIGWEMYPNAASLCQKIIAKMKATERMKTSDALVVIHELINTAVYYIKEYPCSSAFSLLRFAIRLTNESHQYPGSKTNIYTLCVSCLDDYIEKVDRKKIPVKLLQTDVLKLAWRLKYFLRFLVIGDEELERAAQNKVNRVIDECNLLIERAKNSDSKLVTFEMKPNVRMYRPITPISSTTEGSSPLLSESGERASEVLCPAFAHTPSLFSSVTPFRSTQDLPLGVISHFVTQASDAAALQSFEFFDRSCKNLVNYVVQNSLDDFQVMGAIKMVVELYYYAKEKYLSYDEQATLISTVIRLGEIIKGNSAKVVALEICADVSFLLIWRLRLHEDHDCVKALFDAYIAQYVEELENLGSCCYIANADQKIQIESWIDLCVAFCSEFTNGFKTSRNLLCNIEGKLQFHYKTLFIKHNVYAVCCSYLAMTYKKSKDFERQQWWLVKAFYSIPPADGSLSINDILYKYGIVLCIGKLHSKWSEPKTVLRLFYHLDRWKCGTKDRLLCLLAKSWFVLLANLKDRQEQLVQAITSNIADYSSVSPLNSLIATFIVEMSPSFISRGFHQFAGKLLHFGFKLCKKVSLNDMSLISLSHFFLAFDKKFLDDPKLHITKADISTVIIPIGNQVLATIKRLGNCDENKKWNVLAFVLKHLSYCYYKVGCFKKCIEESKKAIKVLEKGVFETKESQLEHIIVLHRRIAICYETRHQYNKAIQAYYETLNLLLRQPYPLTQMGHYMINTITVRLIQVKKEAQTQGLGAKLKSYFS